MDTGGSAIDEVLALFDQASEANFCAASRTGNLVELTPELADEVFLTGDLHGNLRNFQRILELADLPHYSRRHLVLQEVCHGGPEYAEGGCQSHRMLEAVARLVAGFVDRVHFLMGNHELSELSEFPIQKNQRILNLMFRLGMQHCYGDGAEVVHQGYAPFLRSCPLGIRIAGGCFVSHSIPETVDTRPFDAGIFHRLLTPSEYMERGPLFDLVWGRDYRPANAAAFAQLVGATVLINGHEPCAAGYATPNEHQVILDCCGEVGAYVILPIDGRVWTQSDIVQRIRPLFEA